MMPMVEYVKEIESMERIIRMHQDPDLCLSHGKSIAQVSRGTDPLWKTSRLKKPNSPLDRRVDRPTDSMRVRGTGIFH